MKDRDAQNAARGGGFGYAAAFLSLGAIAAAGFTIEGLERFAFPQRRLPNPTRPQVLGTAIRSA